MVVSLVLSFLYSFDLEFTALANLLKFSEISSLIPWLGVCLCCPPELKAWLKERSGLISGPCNIWLLSAEEEQDIGDIEDSLNKKGDYDDDWGLYVDHEIDNNDDNDLVR